MWVNDMEHKWRLSLRVLDRPDSCHSMEIKTGYISGESSAGQRGEVWRDRCDQLSQKPAYIALHLKMSRFYWEEKEKDILSLTRRR